MKIVRFYMNCYVCYCRHKTNWVVKTEIIFNNNWKFAPTLKLQNLAKRWNQKVRHNNVSFFLHTMATAYKTNWVVKTWIESNNGRKCPRHPHIFNEEMAEAKLYTSSICLITWLRLFENILGHQFLWRVLPKIDLV